MGTQATLRQVDARPVAKAKRPAPKLKKAAAPQPMHKQLAQNMLKSGY